MTPSRVDKLYSKLTPHEQASLAFESLANRKKDETDLIIGSVAQHTYQCPHFDFRRRLTDLINLSLYYGLIYWQTRNSWSMAYYQSKVKVDAAAQETAFDVEDRLLAMETALAKVCAELKIDVIAVKKIARCEHEPVFCGVGEPVFVDEYRTLFHALIK